MNPETRPARVPSELLQHPGLSLPTRTVLAHAIYGPNLLPAELAGLIGSTKMPTLQARTKAMKRGLPIRRSCSGVRGPS